MKAADSISFDSLNYSKGPILLLLIVETNPLCTKSALTKGKISSFHTLMKSSDSEM